MCHHIPRVRLSHTPESKLAQTSTDDTAISASADAHTPVPDSVDVDVDVDVDIKPATPASSAVVDVFSDVDFSSVPDSAVEALLTGMMSTFTEALVLTAKV